MKILLTIISVSLSFGLLSQTNAPDITPVDCQGNPHNLYNELDAGKIIVVGWTMPCSVCGPPLLSVHNEVLNYAISNPGLVEFWMFDDFSNTDCVTLKTWCTSNGINSATFFSDNAMNMQDFGGIGMPKVVVLGCTSHYVYYIGNNSFTGAEVGAAINAAMADQANGCILSLNEELDSDLILYPNPANKTIHLSSDKMNQLESISIFSTCGSLLSELDKDEIVGTSTETTIDVSQLAEGSYLLRLNYMNSVEIRRVLIER